MERVYAPWRLEYLSKHNPDECVFCLISRHPNEDETNHVLYRDEFCFLVMNRFPYTPGHFMIIPHTHTDSPEKLNESIWNHMNILSRKSVPVLREFGAHGVNIGVNIGHAGGAGIPGHLHMHLVPRWERDTNFITTISETRVYSADFETIFQEIKAIAARMLT